jgi:hypothetical protein
LAFGITLGLYEYGVRLSPTHLSSIGTRRPPADQLKVGTTWNNTVNVTGSMGSGTAVTGTISTSNKIAAEEKVTVVAGTFDALRVDGTVTEALNSSIAGRTVPLNITMQMSSWYASGVGLVKSVYKLDTVDTTNELVGAK